MSWAAEVRLDRPPSCASRTISRIFPFVQDGVSWDHGERTKIGTTKIAKLVDIFFHMSNPGFSSRTGTPARRKIPSALVVHIPNRLRCNRTCREPATVSFAKGIGVPAVFMIEDHFI